jgi:hypothetical protein
MDALPAPVQAAVDAANRNDIDAFLGCFTPDGVVDDWGREFHGPDAIRGWSDSEFIGVQVSIDVTSVSQVGPVTTIGVRVGGHGYNGGGAFAFTVEGDRVSRMAITG